MGDASVCAPETNVSTVMLGRCPKLARTGFERRGQAQPLCGVRTRFPSHSIAAEDDDGRRALYRRESSLVRGFPSLLTQSIYLPVKGACPWCHLARRMTAGRDCQHGGRDPRAIADRYMQHDVSFPAAFVYPL
jgi:hypothetical protein